MPSAINQLNFFEPARPVSTRTLPVTFIISGDTPSKKNSKQLIQVKGRTIPIPSKHYCQWEKAALKEIEWSEGPLPDGVSVEITVYAQTRRLADLTNRAESVMDLLVSRGVLSDDNWAVVPFVAIKFGGVDRVRPRAEVVISK
jgi:hypothetical protein